MWSFPTVQGDLRDVLLRRCNLLVQDTSEEGQLVSLFGHFDKLWYYIHRTPTEKIPRVSLDLLHNDYYIKYRKISSAWVHF